MRRGYDRPRRRRLRHGPRCHHPRDQGLVRSRLVDQPPSYDASNTRAAFNATVTGDTIRSLNIAFTYDIDNGTFPHTLTDPDVTIVYTEKVNGVSTLYNCALGGEECTITLSRTNKKIVDGTFSSNLTTIDDPNKKVAITGTFSVSLSR